MRNPAMNSSCVGQLGRGRLIVWGGAGLAVGNVSPMANRGKQNQL